jgi:hypothetical protein
VPLIYADPDESVLYGPSTPKPPTFIPQFPPTGPPREAPPTPRPPWAPISPPNPFPPASSPPAAPTAPTPAPPPYAPPAPPQPPGVEPPPGVAPTPGNPGGGFGGGFGGTAAVDYAGIAAQLDAAQREAARQAIIRFGDPALAGLAGFGLDPQAASFARSNYLSGNADLARLDKSHELRRRAIINRLAAHGIIGSGELGYLEGEEGRQYGNESYDARSRLLTYLNELNRSTIAQKMQLRSDLSRRQQEDYGSAISRYLETLAQFTGAA